MAQLNRKHGRLLTRTPMVDAVVEPPEDASTLERILSAIPEGRANALAYARQLAFKDDRYKELIRDFDTDRKQDLGHLCRKHEIAPQDFLADLNREAYPVIDEAMKFAHGISRSIVAAGLPQVVHRGMKEGAKRDGVTDRHFVMQNEGFHVAPKGTVISLTQNQLNQQAAGLEDFSDEVKDMASILGESEPLQLEEGETDYVEAELVDNNVEEQLA